MSRSLIQNATVAYAGALVTNSSSTDDNSSRFDMLGFKNVVFMTTITDSANTGVATLSIQSNSSDSDSGMTAITGSSASATDAGGDALNGTLLIVEAENVLERYVQGVRVSAVANIAFGEIICIRHNGMGRGQKVPLTKHSTVSTQDVQVDA